MKFILSFETKCGKLSFFLRNSVIRYFCRKDNESFLRAMKIEKAQKAIPEQEKVSFSYQVTFPV